MYIDLGFVKIYYYSITILLAVLIGGFLFFKEAKKQNIKKEDIEDILFITLIFGFLGARLYYVLFNLKYYLSNPLEILMVWHGGLAIHGGIILGAIALIYKCKKKNISFLKVLDIAAPSVIIAQAIGRWGNFFNQEAHGPATTLSNLKNLHIPNFIIKGMKIDKVYYHPTFLYESLWNILGFILIILIRKYKKPKKEGVLIGIYFMWYSLARFFIESLRTDSLMFFNLKVAQLVSILLFLLGAYLVFIRKDKKSIKK